MSTREELYDEKISPLMVQIIALCKEHDIPMVATFQINDDRPDGDAFMCSTAILHEGTCDKIRQARDVIYQRAAPPLMLTVRDGEGNIVRMESIVG